jgi:hypothetical protein
MLLSKAHTRVGVLQIDRNVDEYLLGERIGIVEKGYLSREERVT